MSAENASTPNESVEILASVPGTTIPAGAEVKTVLITLPGGNPGTPPHRHPGPAFGYVIKGEVIFELEGEPQRVIKAGETFWEPGGDVIHYQGGNNLPDSESQYIATLLAPPGQPVLTFVSEEELEARKDRRAPRP